MTLREPESRANGKQCAFTYTVSDNPRPPKEEYFFVEVSYSPAPNQAAVEQALKGIDEHSNTYVEPVEVPDIGDAAFVLQPGQLQYFTLHIFRGGTMTLTLSGSITLEQIKALALKALGGPGKTGYVYGTHAPLKKPVLALGAKPNQADQLKRDLTVKAEAGDANAQLALGNLYQFGTLGADGSAQPDYAGAAYWYEQAAGQGVADGAYRLALLYSNGLGVTADPFRARKLLKQAGLSGYVPAMVFLSNAYLELKTETGQTRAFVWAQKAADTGDPKGWFIVGFINYYADRPRAQNVYMYKLAMDAYKKAADGGHCVAMLNIGGLYFNGEGVAQDAKLAQSWFARAEACDSKNLDGVQQKAAKYREKAAKGYLPAVVQTAASGKSGWSSLSDGQKVIAGFVALIVVGVALEIVAGPSGHDSPGNPNAGGLPYYHYDDRSYLDMRRGTGFAGQPCWTRGSPGCF
ncbi:MAG TPA: tetratricopeptide repeat protein [Bryobacteraceae bacterium]|nr:tetratricopeptide repeat protein [Bryobacteraceae bacterium]